MMSLKNKIGSRSISDGWISPTQIFKIWVGTIGTPVILFSNLFYVKTYFNPQKIVFHFSVLSNSKREEKKSVCGYKSPAAIQSKSGNNYIQMFNKSMKNRFDKQIWLISILASHAISIIG